MRLKVVVIIVALVIVTNGLQGTIWYTIMDKKIDDLVAQNESASQILDNIGPLTDVYTVSSKVKSGQEITYEMLVPMKVPESQITDAYVINPDTVVGSRVKIDTLPGIPLTTNNITKEKLDDSERYKDIVVDDWPLGIKVGDYVDIRLIYPKGEDYLVVSHKRVCAVNNGTFQLPLTEKDTLLYSAATVDNFINKLAGSEIYLTKYVEPGNQKPASSYYNPPDSVMAVLNGDPNILEKNLSDAISRDIIESHYANIGEELAEKLSTGRGAYLEVLKEARDAYYAAQEEKAEQQAEEEQKAEDDITDDGAGVVLDSNPTSKTTDNLVDNSNEME